MSDELIHSLTAINPVAPGKIMALMGNAVNSAQGDLRNRMQAHMTKRHDDVTVLDETVELMSSEGYQPAPAVGHVSS